MPDIQSEIEQAQANGEDDLLQRAIEVVKLQKKASISLLQRQLRIGYTRAARLIDQMEEKGIVGPATEDSRWREVLVLGDDRQFSLPKTSSTRFRSCIDRHPRTRFLCNEREVCHLLWCTSIICHAS